MPDISGIIRRAEQLKSARANHESQWQKVADYMLPDREFTRASTPGARRPPLIFNTTPVLMVEHLAGALHGMLTSPALRWFKLRATDDALNGDDAVRQWFEIATDILYRIFTSPAASFDLSLHEDYLDISAFGQGGMFIADRGYAGPRFESLPLGECYVAQNASGVIDTLYRQYALPAREAVRLWPKTVSREIGQIAEKTPDATVEIIHATEPRPEGSPGKPFATCYVEKGHKCLLEDGQFEEFPFVLPRWMKRSGETYGRGPGINAYPDVRALNKMEETIMRGLEKMVDPAMLLPDDGFLAEADFNPGRFNYIRSDTAMDRIRPVETGGRPDLGRVDQDGREKRIRAIFYVEWLTLPSQPNMTATEVMQRRDEMLRMMGPMVSRLQGESLGPIISRTFNIVLRNGGFPPPPRALSGAQWHVEYLGPLALAQKASDAQNALMWMQAIQGMAALDPNVIDIIDTDAAARFLGDRQGAPANLMRARDTIEQLRAARAQRQQQAEQLAAAQQVAGAAKDGAGAMAGIAGALSQGQPPGQMAA